jgi:sarcosine oxidase subunit gamma
MMQTMHASSAKLHLDDFSEWPRAGLKGAAASARLEASGLLLPPLHHAAQQSDGSLVARLSPNEFLALAGAAAVPPVGFPGFTMGDENEPGLCPVPRFAASVWFAVAGDRSAEMFAKICGVDLRPQRFADRSVAQTIVARVSAIVIRDDLASVLRYHLLVDRTMATYVRDVLDDAMAEFERQTL